jgi:hypothetical protein
VVPDALYAALCQGGEGNGFGEDGPTKTARSGARGRGHRGGTGRLRRPKEHSVSAETPHPPVAGDAQGVASHRVTSAPAGRGAESGEAVRAKTLEVARLGVDAKGKRVWTVKEGSGGGGGGRTGGGAMSAAASAAVGGGAATADASGAP